MASESERVSGDSMMPIARKIQIRSFFREFIKAGK